MNALIYQTYGLLSTTVSYGYKLSNQRIIK